MFITLENDQLRAVINSQGAELVSLKNHQGKELIWTGGPEWPRHAPVLFPIIGRMPGDVLTHQGQSFPIKQHGFARDMQFSVVESTAESSQLRLQTSTETLKEFPYHFALEITYSLHENDLSLVISLANCGEITMPSSLGWHPAFQWDGRPGWSVTFEHDEANQVRQVRDVLLTPNATTSPLQGKKLHIKEPIFEEGAIILENVKSKKVSYSSPTGPVIDLAFSDFPHLAIWKQPDAAFVCIEPWFGLPATNTFIGEFATKPAQMHLTVGTSKILRTTLSVH